ELSRGRSVFANAASPGLSRPPARRRRGGPRRVTQLCLRTAAPPDAQNDQGLSEGPSLGADRRRPPERRPPPAAHAPATDRRHRPSLLPLGGPADSPRAARPGQALLRAAGRRRASRLARRSASGERPGPRAGEPGRRDARASPPRDLERLPRTGRGPARGRARSVRPALVPGPPPGGSGRTAARQRPYHQAPLAVGPDEAAGRAPGRNAGVRRHGS